MAGYDIQVKRGVKTLAVVVGGTLLGLFVISVLLPIILSVAIKVAVIGLIVYVVYRLFKNA